MLGPTGTQLGSRARMARLSDPASSFGAMWSQLEPLGEFDRIAVTTKPGLGEHWGPDAVTRELERQSLRAVRLIALADLRWSHLIARSGVELVIAPGDEFESALFLNGVHVPGLALGRHRFRKGRTYEEYLAPRVRERKGVEAWNRRLRRVVREVLKVWNPTVLHVAVPSGVAVALELGPTVIVIPTPVGFDGALSLWSSEAVVTGS